MFHASYLGGSLRYSFGEKHHVSGNSSRLRAFSLNFSRKPIKRKIISSRLASALLISLISDAFKYAAAEYGPQGETVTTNTSTTTNPYESETTSTLKQQAIKQLERNNARPNTVTINQGTLINIYTAQDIDFSSVMK